MNQRESYPPVEAVVAHRGKMLLLDSIEHVADEEIECSVVAGATDLFVNGERVRSIVGIEYMAQTVAAYAGMRDRAAGEQTRIGYLIGVGELLLHAPSFHLGDRLRVRARKTFGGKNVGNFEASIDKEGTTVAEATLTVYRGET